MLIDFKTNNYKSFKNGFDFTMKATRVRDLNESILSVDSYKKFRILPTSVIYGPNAAGKTSIINALYCLKHIVNTGNINDYTNQFNPAYTLLLDLLPFYKNKDNDPVSFDITFEINKNIYEYKLSIDLGKFGESAPRKIVEESLYMNDYNIFIRNIDDIKINIFNTPYKKNINQGFNEKLSGTLTTLLKNSLDEKSLFLTSGFQSFVSRSIFMEVYGFFNNNLEVYINFNDFKLIPNIETDMKLSEDLSDALSEVGIMANNHIYHKVVNNVSKLYSQFDVKNEQKMILSDIIESYGTLRFIDLYPLLVNSLKNGTTLVIDELDTALHPMVVMSILNVYHDPEINKKHAQLIFNTHNPIYLNNKILRRDEMCFVEKNEDKISDFYKMSDFMTNSNNGTRNTTDYINNYFMNKYGAIQFVDLSKVFKKVVG